MASLVGGVRKGALKFGRTVRLLCSSPLPSNHHPVCDRYISSSSKVMKILTESTTIIQDGSTFGELPILIRRATRDTYPFTSHSYSGDRIRAETEFDMTFKDMLENCDSVSDVFNLLEVPSDKVQGHCAVYALQRLHVLMSLNTDWKQIHSFIRRAVIGELYHIVERDIRLLSNFSLVTLVDCYFAAEGFSPTCSEAVHQEISHRLIEGLFTVEELLSLIYSLRTGFRNTNNNLPSSGSALGFEKKPSSFKNTLSENASVYLSTGSSEDKDDLIKSSSNTAFLQEEYQKYQELLRNVWVHLASRCNDMDENTIPWTMQLLPSSKKMFVPLLDKALTDVWPLLSAETAAMCLDNLVRLRSHNSSMMTKLAQYSVVNIHQMTPSVLLTYLRAFLHFSVTDCNFIQVMEKCISKSGLDTPTDLLALCVEYLRSCRHVSPIIMDMAADHFAQHWKSYTPLEIYAVLRNFGELNYLPPDPEKFLKMIHLCLHECFNVLDVTHLLEVMASLTFVTVLSKTFYMRISSDYFFNKVGALKNPNKARALMWLKVLKHAMVMGSCQTVRDEHRLWVLNGKHKWNIFIFQDSGNYAIRRLRTALNELFGPTNHHVIPYYRCFGLYVNAEGVPISIAKNDDNGFTHPVAAPVKRLVILLRNEKQFTSNTKQLLGPQQQRIDHLVKLGYIPIEIRTADFIFQTGAKILSPRLAEHVDFGNPEVAAMKGLYAQDLEEKCPEDFFDDDDYEDMDQDSEFREAVLRDLLDSLKPRNDEGPSVPPSKT